MTEEWRPVAGFDGYYISNHGRVRSPKRGILKGHVVMRNGKPSYITVFIRRVTRSVHSLVLDAFVGPRPIGMEGCHNDGNGLNNTPYNLRWDTHQSNMADAIALGTFVKPNGFKKGNTLGRGTANVNAKLQECDVLNIRALSREGVSAKAVAIFYGLNPSTVQRIVNGKAWPALTVIA